MLDTKWIFEKKDLINFFAFQEELFSLKECEEIIKIGKKNKFYSSKVGSAEKMDSKQRSGNISWINPLPNTQWIFKKISFCINDLNKKFFKFDLDGFPEGFQFTHYKKKQFYDWHIDRGYGSNYARKLSFSIQLTDPSTYKGGDLLLKDSAKEDIMNRKIGTLIIFPSFTLHKVTPVTKGERYSLVGWSSGSNFK